jgi:hypothetical protein
VAHMELEGWPASARLAGATKSKDLANPGTGALPGIASSRSPAAGWKLLVVTVDGSMFLWDLWLGACLVQGSMLPLLKQMSGPGSRGSSGISMQRCCTQPYIFLGRCLVNLAVR